VAAMQEVGLDISGQQTKIVDPFLRERIAYVIALCDREIEDREIERGCPIFPGAIWRLKWPVENPAAAGSREEHRAMVRRARDEIRARVAEFIQANV
jgi:arsenate reductase